MLQIGVHGGALVLTVLLIAALKAGGRSIPSIGGLIAGGALAVLYAKAGDPWSILHQQAGRIRDNIAGELGMAGAAGSAALALSLAVWWWYRRPGAKAATLYGFLILVCAQTANDLWQRIESIFSSLVSVITG